MEVMVLLNDIISVKFLALVGLSQCNVLIATGERCLTYLHLQSRVKISHTSSIQSTEI